MIPITKRHRRPGAASKAGDLIFLSRRIDRVVTLSARRAGLPGNEVVCIFIASLSAIARQGLRIALPVIRRIGKDDGAIDGV
jgi:hypothetical protein